MLSETDNKMLRIAYEEAKAGFDDGMQGVLFPRFPSAKNAESP